MQTRKKTYARNASIEHANARSCRQPKKVTAVAEKKVTDLIASSAKKHKSAIGLKKKIESEDAGRKLTSGNDVPEGQGECIIVTNGTSLEHKKSDDNAVECARGSIFSPSFHYTKEDDVGISGNVDFMDRFKDRDQIDHHDFIAEEANHVNSSFEDDFSALGNLSSEVSAIYFAMQHSKLECIDEQSQDSMSTDGCVEPDETDDLDDFDPYLFIKDLPDLSVVVPKFRPMLLPKQTRSCPSTTLVLDLDETLVHSTLEPCEDADFTFPVNFNLKEHRIYVKCRPYLKDFLDRVASLFETIIFTASQSIYAEQLLNILDPKRKIFRHRVYRESCVYVEGNYLKDLSVLGRDLSRVIIVDNSPQAFGFQLDNGVPIESWFDDRNDQELLLMLPFLESLAGVEDVRPLIARKFNLRQKVASAACLSINFGS